MATHHGNALVNIQIYFFSSWQKALV